MEELIIVGERIERAPLVIKGSEIYLCSDCQYEVWLSPSSQRRLGPGATIICTRCFAKRDVKVDQVESISEEQKEEFRRTVGRDLEISTEELLRILRELEE